MIYNKVNSSVQNHHFPLGDGSCSSAKTTLGKKKGIEPTTALENVCRTPLALLLPSCEI